MKVSDFNYDLPKELIAQHPLEKRDESRLMVLHKDTQEIEHKTFKDIIDYLERFLQRGKNKSQIVNETKVKCAVR